MLSSLRLTKVADNLYRIATLTVRTTTETHGSLGNALTMCTRDDVATKLGNVHNNLPDRATVGGRKILSAIRFRAKTELKPIPSMMKKYVNGCPDQGNSCKTTNF
jgi:hypothetical protein